MRKITVLSALALAATFLPACATKGGTGAAVGAGVGAGAGYLIGRHNGNGTTGAAVGAAVGAGGGYLIGNEMDKSDEKANAPTGPEPVVK